MESLGEAKTSRPDKNLSSFNLDVGRVVQYLISRDSSARATRLKAQVDAAQVEETYFREFPRHKGLD